MSAQRLALRLAGGLAWLAIAPFVVWAAGRLREARAAGSSPGVAATGMALCGLVGAGWLAGCVLLVARGGRPRRQGAGPAHAPGTMPDPVGPPGVGAPGADRPGPRAGARRGPGRRLAASPTSLPAPAEVQLRLLARRPSLALAAAPAGAPAGGTRRGTGVPPARTAAAPSRAALATLSYLALGGGSIAAVELDRVLAEQGARVTWSAVRATLGAGVVSGGDEAGWSAAASLTCDWTRLVRGCELAGAAAAAGELELELRLLAVAIALVDTGGDASDGPCPARFVWMERTGHLADLGRHVLAGCERLAVLAVALGDLDLAGVALAAASAVLPGHNLVRELGALLGAARPQGGRSVSGGG